MLLKVFLLLGCLIVCLAFYACVQALGHPLKWLLVYDKNVKGELQGMEGLVGGEGGIIGKKGKLKEGQPKPRIYKNM